MFLIDLGNYGLWAAYILALYSVVVSIWGGVSKRRDLVTAGRNAAVAVFGLVSLASVSLIILLLNRDYRVEYVASIVNNTLNAFYRFSGFWGGQEGSLLLWLLLLCIFSFTVIMQNRRRNAEIIPYATATLMITAAFWSNLMTEPSFLAISRLVRTITALTNSPFLSSEFGIAVRTEATIMSPI